MPIAMNVFARSEQDLYSNPFAQPKPERSFDSIIAELQAIRKNQAATKLVAAVYSLRGEIESFLDDARTAKREDFEAKHEASILAVREAEKKLTAAKRETFASLQSYTALDSKAMTAGKRASDLDYEFSQLNLALLTKAEKADWAEKRAKANKRAQETTMEASLAAESHNRLVLEESDARKALNAAISAAEEIAREIKRLSKS
jgi:hypothetical protein